MSSGASRSADPGGNPISNRAFDWAAEAAITSVTVVAAVGMSRLFTDASFLRNALTLAIASHVVAAAARRGRLSTPSAALFTGGSLVVMATILFYVETAWFVLPTRDTLMAARDHLEDAWSVMNATSAPVVPVPGLVLATGAALGLTAFLADTAAFRTPSAVTAVVPASAVYGFTLAAGTGGDAVMHGALFCGVAGAALVALRARNGRADSWIESRPGRGRLTLARTGAAAVAVAVAVGAQAGPWLPGAEAEPWVDLSSLEATEAAPWIGSPTRRPEPWADFEPLEGGADPVGDDGPRVLVSPLVQVRSRLVESADRELFTVAVPRDERQYWRLTSLDEFDDEGWGTRSRYEDADGALPASADRLAEGSRLVQTVTLEGLGNSYLPVAYEPIRVVHDGGVAMEYESSSASLVRARRFALGGPSRFAYTVESRVPVIGDPYRLGNADPSLLEPGFLALNTRLPDSARDVVLDEARRITAGARSGYHRALLLQDYFRLGGRFSYDLEIHSGQGIDSLEEFLFDVRAGYCQQFASAYAAMARSVGLPARVAVGFTWGEWDSGRGERGAYVVRGEHAHAWPEVFFAGTGWVRFEPTPGRGAPGDFAVTGYVASQAGLPGVQPAESGQEEPRPGQSPGAAGAVPPNGAGSGSAETGADPGRAGESRSGGAWSRAGGPAASIVLGLAALGLLLGSVPALRAWQRNRRRERLAGDPAGLIEERWSDALEALTLARLAPRPFETPLELARRVASTRPELGPIEDLAILATHGRYARSATGAMADQAALAGSRVVSACRRDASALSRLAAALDPSTLRPGSGARRGQSRSRSPRS